MRTTASYEYAQELELALNELTAYGVDDLATALRGMAALRRLNLRENELESAGAVALAPALASLSALQELDLSGNQIKRTGAVAIARAVAKLPAFERLLLDENEISSDGVAEVKVRDHTGLLWLRSLDDVVWYALFQRCGWTCVRQTGCQHLASIVFLRRQAILMAAGKGNVLGSMDDNDEDVEDDEDLEEEAGPEDQADSELADALAAKAALN